MKSAQKSTLKAIRFPILQHPIQPRHPSRAELDYRVQVLCIKELFELVRIKSAKLGNCCVSLMRIAIKEARDFYWNQGPFWEERTYLALPPDAIDQGCCRPSHHRGEIDRLSFIYREKSFFNHAGYRALVGLHLTRQANPCFGESRNMLPHFCQCFRALKRLFRLCPRLFQLVNSYQTLELLLVVLR